MIRRREEIVRRLRIACVAAALAATLAWTAPVAAQPEGWLPASWTSLPGRVIDWAAGAWRVLAGSETEDPTAEPEDPDTTDSTAVDGSGETSSTTVESQGESYPMIDPNG